MDRTKPTMNRRDRVYRRAEVEDLIAGGATVVIIDNKVYRLDQWMEYHPGGDKAIKHMVGRDATDEVNALHSAEARLRMKNFQIGRVEGRWRNFLPPIQGGHFRALSVIINEEEEEEETKAQCLRNQDISDSSSDSAPPSPVFDSATDPASAFRQRRAVSLVQSDRSESLTSLSSLELEEDAPQKPSFLDSLTQNEIDLDIAKYPSLEPAVQDDIIRKYRALKDRIEAEGLYQCHYTSYLIEISRYATLFSLCLLFLHFGYYVVSATFLGLFWHQLVFSAHDAGHVAITHNYTIDTTLGIIIADFLGGLSLGWWKWSHNVHHIVTNSPEHDPDIEQMPFFAISHRFFESLRSTYYNNILTYDAVAKLTIPYQHLTYYPILALGRFNLYALSWSYLLGGEGPRKGPAWWHRYLEIAGQLFFWSWFGYGIVYRSLPTNFDRILFVLVSHMVTSPVHVQITLSHFAMSTADLGVHESFPQRMLRTTMDVDCPQWLDFIHGGLQFQAIHHLFPRMPRHNLRKAQKMVQQFCDEVGIPYALYGFVKGNQQVIGHLAEIGRQATILAECQRAIATGEVDAHHH